MDHHAVGRVTFTGAMKQIHLLLNLANRSLNKDAAKQITLTGIITTLSTQSEVPLHT